MTGKAQGLFELPDDSLPAEAAAPCRLADAASAAGIMLNVACGGKGACGGCAVELIEGAFARADGTPIDLSDGKPLRVLACQTQLLAGPFRVRVPRGSLVEDGASIVTDFEHAPDVSLRPAVRKEVLRLPAPTLADQRGDIERIIDGLRHRGFTGEIVASLGVARRADLAVENDWHVTVTVTGDQGIWHIVRIEGGDATDGLYGAAVDVGTTTVVVTLVDLNTGKAVDTASSYNRQVGRCDDVASRISYASDEARLEELRRLVVEETVNPLLARLCRRHRLSADDVVHLAVAGNTVMTHLFCGMNPRGLGGVPFAPVSNYPGPYRADQLHVAINAEAFVDLFPSAAAYVGGDITADLFVCGLPRRSELTVMIDIGTNAEIVVGNRDRAIACAAPAGPAFEGHGLSCGMRAAAGAIDAISLGALGENPEWTVIGEGRPAGLCGSGLIDFVASAFRAGLIGPNGRFTDEARTRCSRIRTIAAGESEIRAYEIVPAEQAADGAILITERDLATLLQAKGVVYAAAQIAMKHFGKTFAEVDRFFLAGGFARHIDIDNAVTMGLLPDVDRGRYTFIGNGSLGGAMLSLIDGRVREELPHIAAAPTVIELNLDPEFMDAYAMAMFVPNADPSLFPSVG